MNNIKKLLDQKGILQKEFALDIGVSQPTVSDWINNKKDPRGENLRKVADYFGVSTNDIKPSDPNDAEINKKLHEIGTALHSQTVNQKLKRLTAGLLNMPATDLDFVDRLLSGTYPEYFKEGNEEDDA